MPKSKTTLPFNFLLYLFFSLIILLSYLRTIFPKPSIYLESENEITGRILDYQITATKISYTILTTKNHRQEKVLALWYFNSKDDKLPDITFGDEISLHGTLKVPSKNTIPNTFNYQKYLSHKNIYYLFTIDDITLKTKNTSWYYTLQNTLYQRCRSLDDKGYLAMLIYGKKEIDPETYEALSSLGVIHLFAISGLHLQIFILFLDQVFKKLKLSKKIRTPLIIIFLSFYASLINFPASILRALTFYIFMQINRLKTRPTYQVLILSTSFLLLLNPYFLYDIGFLYSTLCTFGLLYYQDTTKSKLLKSLKTSLIATIWSLPLSISLNYSYNLMSLIFNLFYVPFISFIFYPVCLLSFLFPFLLPLLKVLITILEHLTTILNEISLNLIFPKMTISIIIIYYLLVLFLSKYQKVYHYLILLIFLELYPLKYNLSSNFYAYYLDVSQGDSSIIINPFKKDVTMIDTGGLSREVNNYTIKNIIKFLHSLNIKKIDNLIITHGDFDHIGNALYLVDNFKIKNVYFNYDNFNDLETNLIKRLDQKHIKYYQNIKSIKTSYYSYDFLNTSLFDNENDNSLVTYFKYQDYTFLYMGDASSKREQTILDKYNLKDISILKVGHHGSKTSSSKYFIDKINPKYAVISVGKNNKYGHPNKETLETLKASFVYRTDEEGTIVFIIKKNRLEVKTCR